MKRSSRAWRRIAASCGRALMRRQRSIGGGVSFSCADGNVQRQDASRAFGLNALEVSPGARMLIAAPLPSAIANCPPETVAQKSGSALAARPRAQSKA